MIFTIIAIIIFLYSVSNFKRGFMLYILLETVWYANAKVIALNNFPSIPIYMTTSIAYFALYLFKKNELRLSNAKFPYLLPLILMSFCQFASSITALAGFGDQFSRALGFIFHDVIEIYLMWKIIDEREDFEFMFKGYTIIFLAGAVYGFVEYALKYNPLVAYKSTLNPQGISIYNAHDIFRGYRLMSFVEHPIGCGMTFGLFAIFVFMLYKKKHGFGYETLAKITAVLCLMCVFLTKMRSSIVMVLVLCLSLISIKKTYKVKKRSIYLFIVAVIAVIATYPLYKNYTNVFWSLFSSNAQNAVGGSTLSMRHEQLQSVVKIFKLSPVLGLGDNFKDFLSVAYLNNTFSFESVWFEEMTQHGIFGLASLVIMIYYSVAYIPYKYRSKEACFISLSYWIVYTLTSTPFFRMNFYYYCLFFFIKSSMGLCEEKQMTNDFAIKADKGYMQA